MQQAMMVENCSKVFLAAMLSILVSCASTGEDRLQGKLEQDYRIAMRVIRTQRTIRTPLSSIGRRVCRTRGGG